MVSASPAPACAFFSTYVPRQCGIATFTQDLVSSVSLVASNDGTASGGWSSVPRARVVAIDPPGDRLVYPAEVVRHLDQDAAVAYRDAAHWLNGSGIEVVSLQHEYGIFGGEDGSHVLEFLDALRIPVVSTLHTIRSAPTGAQRAILRELCRRSNRLVVMSERGRSRLASTYGVNADRIRVIPHGAPDVPFGDGAHAKLGLDLAGRRVILSFGLIGPGKCIELVLDALPELAAEAPDLSYVVLGATHPELRRRHGEAYRGSLVKRARDLGLEQVVRFVDRYVDRGELLRWLAASDIFITPYGGADQASSGTLAYAVAAGKAVVSTPYEHARELLAEDRGLLVPFGDVAAIREALRALLRDPAHLDAVRRRAYAYGRSMTWPAVGERYRQVFAEVARRRVAVPILAPQPVAIPVGDAHQLEAWLQSTHGWLDGAVRTSPVGGRHAGPPPLPGVVRHHLRQITDTTGIFQHAAGSQPDPRHGYCTDDVARALVVDVLHQRSAPDPATARSAARAVDFLWAAFDTAEGRFRNFLNADGTWIEAAGSEDCHGRVIQACGDVLAVSVDPMLRNRVTRLMEAALPAATDFTAIRPAAYAILGCAAVLGPRPGMGDGDRRTAADTVALSETARRVLVHLGGNLATSFAAARGDGAWPWPEPILTYDNAALPRALVAAGRRLGRTAWMELGLQALDWLVGRLTTPGGHFSPVGNAGWWPRGGPRARFDQQPIDAGALVEAAVEAYVATAAPRWPAVAERAFAWFLGANDVGIPVAVPGRGACRDGLGPAGVNLNEGAESTLAWLLAVERMRGLRGDLAAVTRGTIPSRTTAPRGLTADFFPRGPYRGAMTRR
jgi:glycosyltransferase involved in cell wall biosynthesis